MPYHPQSNVQSVKSGATASARKVLDALASPNSAPSLATDGNEIRQGRFVLVVLQAATDTVNVRLWTRDAVSEVWCPDLVYGEMSIEAASPRRIWLECMGADRVYVQLTDIDPDSDATDGTLTAWVATVTTG